MKYADPEAQNRIDELEAEVKRLKKVIPDREHIRMIFMEEIESLREWLKYPNGAHVTLYTTFESVGGGSVWVRTKPNRE